MSEWITDRLPTKEDSFAGQVILSRNDGVMSLTDYKDVDNGEPWQRIQVPEPYIYNEGDAIIDNKSKVTMTERKPNKPTPIDTWKSIVECFSAKSYPWNSRTDALGVMRNWVFETLKELKLSRGIDIDLHRIYYFSKKLQTMDYTPMIAEGAQLWMEIGDWTHKGSNPTVELSDFFPTEEQIESVRKRMNRDKLEKVGNI